MNRFIFEKFEKFNEKSNFQSQILNDYIKEDFKKDLIDTLNNELLLEEIAQRTVVHSNGFIKIVLSSMNGWKLRLHLWPVVNYIQEHEPHSHRWDFTSYIISGSMINEIYEENNSDNKTFLKCLAHETKFNSKRTYDIISENSLIIKNKDIHNKGEIYTLVGNKVHIAKIPIETFTSTLFLTSPAVYESSVVYMPDLIQPPSDFVLETVNIDKLKESLSKVLKGL